MAFCKNFPESEDGANLDILMSEFISWFTEHKEKINLLCCVATYGGGYHLTVIYENKTQKQQEAECYFMFPNGKGMLTKKSDKMLIAWELICDEGTMTRAARHCANWYSEAQKNGYEQITILHFNQSRHTLVAVYQKNP